jgi:hypothetical protein
MRLERVNPWERIASRRRPAFSSPLKSGVSSFEIHVAKKFAEAGSIGTLHYPEQCDEDFRSSLLYEEAFTNLVASDKHFGRTVAGEKI